MLELKNLAKTYTPKKGVPVQALKGINLSFGETGLVFVLGKSGSGKSTLLNLIGGLDSADNGEIVIKGKSSKDFKTLDYDNYRNMYVGFVFQEYNILNEFTVGENISLAIELQNKKEDKELLDDILKEVDLEGYADRKPNELSGGQKQRVAIARALIKSPQIVLADEPTGALDSATGKAIFDTLKKISKEKLVIVVSHDREFAEKYGDRVIELADGEVISDLSKQGVVTQNEKYDGSEKFIKSRLPYRYAIKMGASSIKSKPLRLAVTILLCFVTFAVFGVVDVFNAFNVRKILIDAYTDGDVQNLVFSAINLDDGREYELNGLSWQDLNLLNTKSSSNFMGVTYLSESGEINISFLDNSQLYGNNHSRYYSQCLNGLLPASNELFDSQGFELTGRMPENENEIVLTQYIMEQINLAGHSRIKAANIVPNKNRTAQEFVDGGYYIELDKQEFKVVGIVDTKADPQGKYDWVKPSTMEIASNEEFDNAQSACEKYFKYGYHSLGYVFPSFYQDLTASHSFDMTSWDSFGKALSGEIAYSSKKGKFQVVASDSDLDKTSGIIWLDGNERKTLQDNEIVIGLNFGVKLYSTNYDDGLTYKHYKDSYFGGIVEINDDLRFNYFSNYYSAGKYYACLEEAEKVDLEKLELFKEYIKKYCLEYPNYESEILRSICGYRISSDYSPIFRTHDYLFEYEFDKMTENQWRFAYAIYLANEKLTFNIGVQLNPNIKVIEGGYENNVTGLPNGRTLENIDGKRFYVEGKLRLENGGIIKTNTISWSFEDIDNHNILPENFESWDIVGIYIPRTDYPELEEKDTVIFNNALYKKAQDAQEIVFNFAIAPIPTSKKEIITLIDLHLSDKGVRNLRIHDNIASVARDIDLTFWLIKLIMIIAGVGVAIFSILLMSNYIAMSISNRKREIGILRALGAKTSDVFSIFANESIIMALINTVLSVFVALGASIGLNKFYQARYSAGFTILSFGIRQIVIILLISVATAILSSLIPIYRLSKKKPIDCIQDR